MSVSPLSEGGRVALAAKQATSATLGLELAVGMTAFEIGLWRVYLPHASMQAANPARRNTLTELADIISETAAIMAPVRAHPDVRHAQRHISGVLSEAIVYLAGQRGCRAPIAAVARSLQGVISIMESCVYQQISQRFDSVLQALGSVRLLSRCVIHKENSCEARAEAELFNAASIIMKTESTLQLASWSQGRTSGKPNIGLSD